MYNLVLKDFKIQKKYLKELIFNIVLTFLVIQFFSAGATYSMVPFMIAISFIFYGCGFGEKNDTDIMLVSLPVDRKDIVISKYISSIIFLIASIAITILLGSIIKLFSFSSLKRIMNFQDIVFCTFSTIAYISIYLPLYFKFGYIKSQRNSGIIIVCILTFQFVIVMASGLISNGTARKFIMELVKYPHFNLIISALGIILSFLLLFISIIISVKIYISRDF